MCSPSASESEGSKNVQVTKLDNIVTPISDGTSRIDVIINWRYVESSNVKRVGWDKHGNMYVEYLSGDCYAYMGVSRQRAVATAYSNSVGRYINRKIKKHFRPVKLGVTS